MSDIFFSYSRKDSKFVDGLIEKLQAKGVDIWVDRGQILAGESWRRSIVEAIRECQVFIIVLSPDSVKSENVTKELTLAEQYDKRVLPLVARDVQIPPALDYQLAGLHYQTFAEGDYEDNFESLVKALIATGIPVKTTPSDSEISLPIDEEPIQRISATSPSKLNSLRQIPIWLWAGGGIVILIGLIIGLFSIFGNNQKPNPTATEEVAIIDEILTETPTLTPTNIPTDTLEPTESPTLAPSEVIPPTLTPYPPLIQDDFGISMVLVPEGSFMMGSTEGDPDEKPVVEVVLESFYIDQFEVTNASYKECVDLGICSRPLQFDSQTRLQYYGANEYANFPVIYVTWEDANVYCEWRGARLPTEAEWEKAARGPDGWKYPWGNEFEEGRANYCGGAVFCPSEPNDGFKGTAPVDAFESGISPYGAYQMAGNVNEWVADWYDKNYYRSLEDGAENPTGPAQGQERSIRGGSFGLNAEKLRTTNRGFGNPFNASEYDGFRCAADLPSP